MDVYILERVDSERIIRALIIGVARRIDGLLQYCYYTFVVTKCQRIFCKDCYTKTQADAHVYVIVIVMGVRSLTQGKLPMRKGKMKMLPHQPSKPILNPGQKTTRTKGHQAGFSMENLSHLTVYSFIRERVKK